MAANVSLQLAQAKRKLILTDDKDRLGVEVNDELAGHVEYREGAWHPINLDGGRVSPFRKFGDRKAAALAVAYNHLYLKD